MLPVRKKRDSHIGYTTDFEGKFDLNVPLTPAQVAYLKAFAGTRRVKRNAKLAAELPDPLREAVGLPIGPKGDYFDGTEYRKDADYYVGSASDGNFGQNGDPSVHDGNSSGNMPSLWCQWVPTDDGTAIQWDGGEKFYEYENWLRYIVEEFLVPWGRTLNGTVAWTGEDPSDRGKLIVKDNVVTSKRGRVTISYE